MDQTQLLKLLAIYLLMMLPFFCAGLGIGLILWHFGKEAGAIYASDILGAGVGSLGVIGMLFLAPPDKVLVFLTALALLAASIAIMELGSRPKWPAAAFFGLGLLVSVALPANWLQAHPSPYKDLSQVLNIMGSQVIAERSSPLGQITVVENTGIPFRHAPGMSLNALDEPPPQLAVFVDGDGPSVLTRFDGGLAPLAYLDQLTSALPYHLLSTSPGCWCWARERAATYCRRFTTAQSRLMRWSLIETSSIWSGSVSMPLPAIFTASPEYTCMKPRPVVSSVRARTGMISSRWR